jgi:KaiC/GvpD/RAD55 family RecA-like ATPase
MKRIGFDSTMAKDLITVVDIAHLRKFLGLETPGTSIDWLRVIASQIKFFHEEGYPLVAIDSLDALYVLSPVDNVRNRLFHFFEELRDTGVSLFMISEMDPGSRAFGKYGVEGFLCDGIIHLEIERIGKTVGRFISIVKMRGASHPTDYFPLIVDKGEFRIVQR